MKQQVIALAALLAIAAGCAQEKDEQKPAGGLRGQWRSNCAEGASAALLTQADLGITQHSELKIGKKTAEEISYISSQKCNGKDIEVSAAGPYDVTSSGSLVVQKITYKVKPLTEFGTRVLNLSKWCGISDWIIGDQREVTDEAGKEKCFASRETQASFSVDGEKLRIGSSDRLSASTYGISSLSFRRR